MSVNKVILLGNLGSNPELRKTKSDKPVCTFSLATDRSRKDSNGTTEQSTVWHNIVCFGKSAESCAKYLKKGRQVYLEGRIQTEKWEDKSGATRVTNKIVASVVQFLGKPLETVSVGSQLNDDTLTEPDGDYM